MHVYIKNKYMHPFFFFNKHQRIDSNRTKQLGNINSHPRGRIASKIGSGSPKGLKFFPNSCVTILSLLPLPLAGTLHGPKKAEAVPGVTSRHDNIQVSTRSSLLFFGRTMQLEGF